MSRSSRFPLHYQILIALILGALIGWLINPGETELEDVAVQLTFAYEHDTQTNEWRLSVRGPKGRENYTRSFRTLADLKKSCPELAASSQDSSDRATSTRTVMVTERRVHVVENARQIAIRYSRRQTGIAVSTTIKAANASELAHEFPQWVDVYEAYHGGLAARITSLAKSVGDLFLQLLKMITVPLILTSLVTGVASLGDTKRLGAMFGKTLLYYISTSLLAITTGIILVNLIRPGIGAELPGGSEAVLGGSGETLPGILMGLTNKMIPANPIQALAEAQFLSIITFSILLGIFIIHTGGKSGETLRNLFQAGFDVMMNMTLFVIRLAPIGVFAFMLFGTASQGLSVFRMLGWYMLTVFLALLVHAVVVLPLIVRFVARRSPSEYARAMSPALMTAFSTASSNGTLPLTLTCVEERAGISNRISSFVLPLGATVNMDGTALYEAVAVLFIAQAYFGAVPVSTQIVVALTALLASVGAAGIPHAGLVMMAIVLQAVNLPIEAQGLIIAVDRVLDMCRTSVNVWSDSCGCAVLSRFEKHLENTA